MILTGEWSQEECECEIEAWFRDKGVSRLEKAGTGDHWGGVRGSRARDHCACRAIWISGFPGVVLDLAGLKVWEGACSCTGEDEREIWLQRPQLEKAKSPGEKPRCRTSPSSGVTKGQPEGRIEEHQATTGLLKCLSFSGFGYLFPDPQFLQDDLLSLKP